MRTQPFVAGRGSRLGRSLLLCGLMFSAECRSQPAVQVQRRGETVVIDVDMPVPAAPVGRLGRHDRL